MGGQQTDRWYRSTIPDIQARFYTTEEALYFTKKRATKWISRTR